MGGSITHFAPVSGTNPRIGITARPTARDWQSGLGVVPTLRLASTNGGNARTQIMIADMGPR